jgi:GntR family transcriptional regulator/MocR family aminotransferase
VPDLASFPVDVWRRLAAKNLRALSSDVGGYGDAAGQPRLRAAIARYLAHSRAVLCGPQKVFIWKACDHLSVARSSKRARQH